MVHPQTSSRPRCAEEMLAVLSTVQSRLQEDAISVPEKAQN